MRHIIAALVILALAAGASAQGPGPDTIGFWFDAEGTTNVLYDPPVGLLFHGYVIIHAPSHTQIGGAEVSIAVPDGVLPLSLEVPPGGYNFGDSLTNLLVAWHPPLDGDPDLMFADLTLMIIAEPTLPAFFVLGPAVPTSFPEENLPGYGYWDGDDVPLVPLDYAFGDPAAARFEPGTVAVESRSLSAVKRLFD